MKRHRKKIDTQKVFSLGEGGGGGGGAGGGPRGWVGGGCGGEGGGAGDPELLEAPKAPNKFLGLN